MLEASRTKSVPPQILKGFKDDVLRRIASAPAPRPAQTPARWFSSGFKLPRVGMSVGAGAHACLILASIAVLTMEKPFLTTTAPRPTVSAAPPAAFQVASVPAAPASVAMSVQTRAFDKIAAVPAPARAAAASQPVAVRAKLTVEEELRLIEEFDDQKFFIRQDITDGDLGAA